MQTLSLHAGNTPSTVDPRGCMACETILCISGASLQGTHWAWVLCPLERSCPLLGGYKCAIAMGSRNFGGSLVLCSEAVLLSEGPLSELGSTVQCVYYNLALFLPSRSHSLIAIINGDR